MKPSWKPQLTVQGLTIPLAQRFATRGEAATFVRELARNLDIKLHIQKTFEPVNSRLVDKDGFIRRISRCHPNKGLPRE
jgi:hypothetical protein